MEKIIGLCDLFFEVTYGAAEGLHSIAVDTLKELLRFCFSEKTHSDKDLRKSTICLIRHLFVKLINEVDTMKQRPIIEALISTINVKEEG